MRRKMERLVIKYSPDLQGDGVAGTCMLSLPKPLHFVRVLRYPDPKRHHGRPVRLTRASISTLYWSRHRFSRRAFGIWFVWSGVFETNFTNIYSFTRSRVRETGLDEDDTVVVGYRQPWTRYHLIDDGEPSEDGAVVDGREVMADQALTHCDRWIICHSPGHYRRVPVISVISRAKMTVLNPNATRVCVVVSRRIRRETTETSEVAKVAFTQMA